MTTLGDTAATVHVAVRAAVLLALADRVERESPTFALEREIGAAAEPEYGDPPRRYMTSLDAVRAFQEAALPGWWVRCGNRAADSFYAMLREPAPDYEDRPALTGNATAPTECQARLSACLRAMAAEAERG